MRARIDAFPWSATPLGASDAWPTTLRVALQICLSSGFPIVLWWGPELTQLYNDAYVAILGKRHPWALGRSVYDVWPEAAGFLRPIFGRILVSGEPYTAHDMQFMLERNGVVEETYFTFSYSVLGPPGAAGGILNTVMETTNTVLREREFRAMADTLANIVYTHAPDGRVEWANIRWYEYSRLPRDIATTPEGWVRVLPAGDFRRLESALARAFATGGAYELEVRVKPDGTSDDAYRWFLLRAVPMVGADGAILRWAGSATDIHDRRIAEDAVRAEFEREHTASIAFQKAALPQSLPHVAGLTFSAVYEPAEAEALVGGDWFDAFRLADGRIVLSVGDVVGKGLSAAVTMAGVRQAIRGAAQVYPEPVDVLDAVDRALGSEQPDRIVTAFVGVLDPLTLTLSYASAGHPSPFVRRPDGTIDELGGVDLPLGLRGGRRRDARASESATLLEGSLLVLYTDGLIEATRDVLEGSRRLREALASDLVFDAVEPAAFLRRAVLARANESDDVAILTIRFGGVPLPVEPRRWAFPARDAESATKVRHEIGLALQRAGATLDESGDAELVFGELIGNVVRHASGDIEAALDLSGDAPVLHVLDRGPGFTFYVHLPYEMLSESGRGLFIVTSVARDVNVVRRPGGGSHARAVLSVARFQRGGAHLLSA